jgi:hypothetical protein
MVGLEMSGLRRIVAQMPGGAAIETIGLGSGSFRGKNTPGGNEGVGEHVRTRFRAGRGPGEIADS